MNKINHSDIRNTIMQNVEKKLSDDDLNTYSIIYKILLLSKMLCLEIETKNFKLGNIRLLNRIRAAYNHLEKLPNEIIQSNKSSNINFSEIFPEYDEEKMYLLMDLFYNSLFQTEEQLRELVEKSNNLITRKIKTN